MTDIRDNDDYREHYTDAEKLALFERMLAAFIQASFFEKREVTAERLMKVIEASWVEFRRKQSTELLSLFEPVAETK